MRGFSAAHRLVESHLERCAVDGAARRARLAAHAHLLLGPREQRAEQADDAEEEHRAVGKVQPPHAHLRRTDGGVERIARRCRRIARGVRLKLEVGLVLVDGIVLAEEGVEPAADRNRDHRRQPRQPVQRVPREQPVLPPLGGGHPRVAPRLAEDVEGEGEEHVVRRRRRPQPLLRRPAEARRDAVRRRALVDQPHRGGRRLRCRRAAVLLGGAVEPAGELRRPLVERQHLGQPVGVDVHHQLGRQHDAVNSTARRKLETVKSTARRGAWRRRDDDLPHALV